jgi:folate-binding protein YgfZ
MLSFPLMSQPFFYSYKPAAAVRASGEDAFSFLQSQATQELRLAQKNIGVYSLWLNHKGKVIGDSFVFRVDDETLLLFSPSTPVATLLPHWQKHIVADEVELEDQTAQWFGLACNDAALGVIANECGNAGAPRSVPGLRETHAWHELFWNEEQSLQNARQALEGKGAEALDETAMELRRIYSGMPRVPVDLGTGDLPAEGGLVEAAVSFTKGCFLGQEIVARMHHVGRARRGLFRLRGQGALPDAGSPLLSSHSDKPVGELRSGIQLIQGGWVGLAMCDLKKMQGVSELTIQNQLTEMITEEGNI